MLSYKRYLYKIIILKDLFLYNKLRRVGPVDYTCEVQVTTPSRRVNIDKRYGWILFPEGRREVKSQAMALGKVGQIIYTHWRTVGQAATKFHLPFLVKALAVFIYII